MKQPHKNKNKKEQAKTPAQWREVWDNKTVLALKEHIIDEAVHQAYHIVIQKFRKMIPFPPLFIYPDPIKKFVLQENGSSRLTTIHALKFFYTYVSPSQKHCDLLDALGREFNIKVTPVLDAKALKSASDVVEEQHKHNAENTDLSRKQNALLKELAKELRLKKHDRPAIQNYCATVQIYLEWLERMPAAHDTNVLKAYLLSCKNEKKYVPRTIDMISSMLMFFYEQVLKFPIKKDEITQIQSKRPVSQAYSEQEIGWIISAAQDIKPRLILMMAYGSGLKVNELRSLKRKDIDFETSLIKIRHGKGNEDRTIGIDSNLKRVLKDYIQKGTGKTWFFEDEKPGQKIPEKSIELMFELACKKAKVVKKDGIQSLRKTFASHLLEQGVDAKNVQELLGHAPSKNKAIPLAAQALAMKKVKSPLSNIKIREEKLS